MHGRALRLIGVVALTVAALTIGAPSAVAFNGIGQAVDDFCSENGRLPPAPYQGDCQLCHTAELGPLSPQFDWAAAGDYAQFCPETVANRPPDGTILRPDRDLTVTVGAAIEFQGEGTDPDGDIPLALQWDFGDGAAGLTGAGPHTVSFAVPGSYTVSLTVVDARGLPDPTPATRVITVEPEVSCTDSDADGFFAEGDGCGPVDCDDTDPAVNPNAIELCTDGLDNNCDGRVDGLDPLAVGCSGCVDQDGDRFSPQGGICGPVDCDDSEPGINPGAEEACADRADNDCDGMTDGADSECDGSDCIDALLNRRLPPDALRVSLDPERAPWVPLEGAVLTENVYIFIPDAAGMVQVRFWLDGELRQTEAFAPWDFAGGTDTAANPLDTRTLADGGYTLLAEVDFADGVTLTLSAAFSIVNPPAPTVAIEAASWSANPRMLDVTGNDGPVGGIVNVFNPATAEHLGETRVRGNGAWRLKVNKPDRVPCRVQVRIFDGDREGVAEAPVKGAPADCL
jgi:PKD repeat protein